MLQVGHEAPDFELPNQDGEMVSLSDYKGEIVVLYFYPQADSPGCTKEACSFRDNWGIFEEKGIAVLGVSTDPVDDIHSFAQKHDLPFELLSDINGEVAEAYASYGQLEFGNISFMGAFRNTYVIDEDGVIESVHEGVSPENHAIEIANEI